VHNEEQVADDVTEFMEVRHRDVVAPSAAALPALFCKPRKKLGGDWPTAARWNDSMSYGSLTVAGSACDIRTTDLISGTPDRHLSYRDSGGGYIKIGPSLRASQAFLDSHPQYQSLDFFVFGESYVTMENAPALSPHSPRYGPII
jgi:hypothetical protein